MTKTWEKQFVQNLTSNQLNTHHMNITKVNLEDFKKKATALFKTAGKIALIVGALFVGAIGRDIYVKVTVPKPTQMESVYQVPKTISETSVAVNERGELMLIDRNKGTYQLYQDSVGRMIFNMYAAKIYIDKNN